MRQYPVYIGTSGWYYDHWEGILYPPGLAKSGRFAVYAENFNAVEINATFYRLPSQSMVSSWYQKAPDGFIYVVKAHKVITHNYKLHNVQEALDRFYAAIEPLREKVAAVLFQLPPSLKQDKPLLEDFLEILPRRPYPCIEFRHTSWEKEKIYALLEEKKVTHVAVSMKNYPFVERHTGEIVYYRLHGPMQMCASPYAADWLLSLSDRLADLSGQHICSFVFFNNDVGGHAVYNARLLATYVAEKMKRIS